MRIAKFKEYGDYHSIYIDDVEVPKVTEGTVLVEIHSASINMLDVRVLTGNPVQVRKLLGEPTPELNTLGSDFSGVVVEVAEGLNEVKVGDEVFGQLAITQGATFADYALVPVKQLSLKPKGFTHSKVSTIPMAGVTALQALRMLNLEEGSKVLIYGASGGVGTFAIQVAKAIGAHVTAVCSTRNIDKAKESHADIIIDYKKDNWFDPCIKYDGIFAVNGYNHLKQYLDSIKDNANIVLNMKSEKTDLEKEEYRNEYESRGINLIEIYAKINVDDYSYLSTLLIENRLTPFVDKEFALENIHEAYRHFMSGKTVGKTVIKMK